MSLFLTVILCLANGPDAECRSVTIGPLQSRAECKARYDAIRAELAALSPLHIGGRCDLAWAG